MIIRSTLREIRTSITRYLAIFAIVALGVGFFSGLKICKADMTKTAGKYLVEHCMYDYMIASSYGIDDESVSIAKAEAGVSDAEGSVQIDVMAYREAGDDIPDNNGGSDKPDELALRAISLPEHINTLELLTGRMPENEDECVADDYSMEGNGFSVRDRIVLSESNDEDKLANFRGREFTVVGTVNSPLFLDYQRGTTEIGSGSLNSYFYLNVDAFDADYYTRLYLTLDGSEEYFTEEKSDMIDAAQDRMDELAERITAARRDAVESEVKEKLSNPVGGFLSIFTIPVYRAEKTYAKRKLADIDSRLNSSSSVHDGSVGGSTPLSREKEDTYRELIDTEKKIADAGKMLEYMQSDIDGDEGDEGDDGDETGESYAVSVYQDPGYTSFDNNADIVSNIAKVFPVFFFVIAALVCMTTMTRMIDEQRSQIGILRALGYRNSSILCKYMFYSGSAAFLGAVSGFYTGCILFPFVIWRAYGISYDFSSQLEYVFDAKLGFLSLICALICTAGATWVSVARDFLSAPSELIRPKTPPAGKRILLERITPLWDRISFLYKVSFRNVFRDKKRFFMMVAGVSGCTALLVAGNGLGTTVADVADHQFDEILLFDYRVIFNKDMSESMQQDFAGYMSKEAGTAADEIMFVHQDEVTLLQSGEEADVTCIAADEKGFGRFIDLHQGEKVIDYPGTGEVVIVKNISREYGIGQGDKIRIRAGGREGDVTVSGICDNYMYDTFYISKETYEKVFDTKPEIRSALVSLTNDGADQDEISEEMIRGSAVAAANYDDTSAVTVNLDVRSSISDMMQSLDLVTYVIILSAALLAFVVIYNLTNINITERIREIATIKVLGFYPLEVSQYVFRENMFMTAIAAAVGVPLGKWLLDFVFDKVAMKMLYFEARMNFADVINSVALTFVFAFLVNLAMQMRLRNISMTESLKSTE